MKKYLVVLTMMLFALVGCGENTKQTITVNVEGIKNVQSSVIGTNALIEIGNDLWYDQSTKIVYLWNGQILRYNNDTTPSAYFAPNGMPYLFNPETSTFEMIEK